MDALRQVDGWGAGVAAAGVVRSGEVVATHGPRDVELRWASVTKPVTALAVLVAAEEGILDLDELAGPPGSTVRHLLAHASGLPFEGEVPISRPGTRRIYSNSGYEVLAQQLASRAEMPFPSIWAGPSSSLSVSGARSQVRPARVCTARSMIYCSSRRSWSRRR